MGKSEYNTPMMKQYLEIKAKHRDTILMFRLGDFYEMFLEDAEIASKLLSIALTTRNKSDANPIPLCGVPFHSADSYIAKLVKAGKRVAICEQVEDPKKAKGLVKREVIRIITPGVNLDDKMLEVESNNHLLSYHVTEDGVSISFIDISTEEFKYTYKGSFPSAIDEIITISPKEIVISDEARKTSFTELLQKRLTSVVFTFLSEAQLESFAEIESFDYDNNYTQDTIKDSIKHSLKTILSYLKRTHYYSEKLIDQISFYESGEFMGMDARTKAHLELVVSSTNGKSTLFNTLNYTKTPMAKRKLKHWILYPLFDKNLIERRLTSVTYMKENSFFRDELVEIFSTLYDMRRLTGRVTQNSLTPKDALSLKKSLIISQKIATLKAKTPFPSLIETNIQIVSKSLAACKSVIQFLYSALSDDPPYTLKEGGVIKDAYSKDLDDLRKVKFSSKEIIAGIESREREKTGISTLKIKFNKVFGYFIEVSSSKLDLVPEAYIRKQTISNGERYITQELKELESKILTAQEKIEALETEIFNQLRETILGKTDYILALADAIATLDVICSLAFVAHNNDYVKPEISNSFNLDIRNGRHPVVEKLNQEPYVPNDTFLDNSSQNHIILTGPNMAGKSTIMRQSALIVIMAQLGSYVPAESAKVGLVDKLFTRIGATDDLVAGDSTFMVEMKEASYILKNATKKSLILLDEIGRGTSTYDGLSLAWAISEFIYKKIKARTLFATHYHELTNLTKLYKGIKNFNIAVKEKDGCVYFLHKLVEGGVNRSYGIHVAKLADLHEDIITAAYKKLEELETKASSDEQLTLFSPREIQNANESIDQKKETIISELALFNTSTSTPLEALVFIEKTKQVLKGDGNKKTDY